MFFKRVFLSHLDISPSTVSKTVRPDAHS